MINGKDDDDADHDNDNGEEEDCKEHRLIYSCNKMNLKY